MKMIQLLLCFGTMYAAEPIVFQPRFNWADETSTLQGTGSLVKGPKGSSIGLTSAHFIDFSGSQLLSAEWLDIRTEEPAAVSTKSWGMPGHEGTYDPMDLRSDYLLLEMNASHAVLELDDRSGPEVGERVWFPNKNGEAALGYDRIEGKVVESKKKYISIVLDQEIVLHSRSGTPVISMKNGKVIGILSSSEKKGDQRYLYLTPAFSIRRSLFEAKEHPLLQEVIGNSQ